MILRRSRRRSSRRSSLAAGRFEIEQKGFDLLLDAMARLEGGDARLVLLGDGPLRVRLAAHAARLGIADRVSMPGHVATIREALDQARLYVVSSDYEGYPAVAIEALAAGVPVVATDCSPAMREILCDPIRGTIVPSGDTAALAAAIDARLGASPPARALLAATVIGHRIGPIAGQYLDLFDRITGRTCRYRGLPHRRQYPDLARFCDDKGRGSLILACMRACGGQKGSRNAAWA